MINKILNRIQEGKSFKVFTIILFFLLITTALADTNLTGEIPQEPQEAEESEQTKIPEEIPAETADLCKDITCQDSSIQCQDGTAASCPNTCNSETGACSTCEPDCTGHEALPEEPGNESISLPSDGAANEVNETNKTEEGSLINSIEPISSEPASESGISAPGSPNLDIQFFYPNKITRGEMIELQARITNKGDKTAANVIAELQLPPELKILSGNRIENCGSLAGNQTCEVSVKIRTSSASLGNNKIKILVKYDE